MNEIIDVENIQIDLLLEAIVKRYGYDFRDYARSSFKRRVNDYMNNNEIQNFYELLELILTEKSSFSDFLSQMSVNVTEMFRDPLFFETLRKKVIPALKTYPSINVWLAGCATGEEAYSLAILLEEEGLLNKTKIYATDIDPKALECAIEGMYSLEKIKKYTENYVASKGEGVFSDYYSSGKNQAIMKASLKQNITFANHNLVSDKVFSQVNLVLCRNVLIYFNEKLQTNVLTLLDKSLQTFGYFCLGSKETLSCTVLENRYSIVDNKSKIYRKEAIL